MFQQQLVDPQTKNCVSRALLITPLISFLVPCRHVIIQFRSGCQFSNISNFYGSILLTFGRMQDQTLIFRLSYRNSSEPLTVFEIFALEICLYFSCGKFGMSYYIFLCLSALNASTAEKILCCQVHVLHVTACVLLIILKNDLYNMECIYSIYN